MNFAEAPDRDGDGGDEIRIEIELELVQQAAQDESQAAARAA